MKANPYQYQTSQPEKQAALLTLASWVVDWCSLQTDHVILGGDWNASLRPCIGYCRAPLTVLADERLLWWSVVALTWSTYNEQKLDILDCSRIQVQKRRFGLGCPGLSDRHDHRWIRVELPKEGMAATLPAGRLRRPLRWKLKAWALERAHSSR